MATKKIYYDNDLELEVFSNNESIHLELSSDETIEPSFLLSLTSDDVLELIEDLQNHVDKLNGFKSK